MSSAVEISVVEERVKELSGWTFEGDSLKKTFSFPNYREAMGFLVRMSFEAEDLNHHPEIFNVYGTVKITLRTHDAGNKVTDLDFKLAKAIEGLSAV